MSKEITTKVAPQVSIRDRKLKLRLQRLADQERRTIANKMKLLLTDAVEKEERENGLDEIHNDPKYQHYFA